MNALCSTSLKFLQLFLITLFISACGGGSSSSSTPVDPPQEPPVNPPEVELSTKNIMLNVLDVDGSVFTQNVDIDLSGAEILDANQNVINSISFPSTNSFQARIPADANVDLKILAKTNNYVDSGITLQLNPDETDYSPTLFLVPNVTGSAKPGIFTQVDTISDVANAVAQNDITLSLEESASTPKLTVSIPQGTQFSDSNGNPVTPDSSTLVRYDPLEAGVLDAYPGGLNVMADVNGEMEQVNFKSAGFASIVLQNSSGEKVKKFDQDITIAMQFKIGITDNTGKVAAIDDIVPIWSFDEDDGSWRYERDGVVKDLDPTDGLYDVTYQTDHLTFYNLDWNIANVCNATFSILDSNNDPQSANLNVNFTMPAFNIDQTFFYRGDGSVVLLNVPEIETPWSLVFTEPFSDDEVGRISSTESICGEHTVITDIEEDTVVVDDGVENFLVEAIATSGGSECDFSVAGTLTVTDETVISGNVDGLTIEGTRNPDNGQVTFGQAGSANNSIATFDGTINNGQANGTWSDTSGVCSGTWSGTPQ